jgi:molecular chaperone HtpG
MMSETMETLQFQAEARQLLDLMIHSLYSNKEIFLRELISNASDAADKLRFEAATDDSLFEGDADLNVHVAVDRDARTITVRDNGIGMSRDEVVNNIGTIARSGTRQFLETLSGDRENDAHLIGQFGVGFYSAFLVADKVTLITRRAGMGPEHGVRWESTGDGEYTLETIEAPARGTEITLHLREDAGEFLDPWRLRGIVHKYADHIPFPIRMDKAGAEEGEETVNQASALWTRPKSELSNEDYANFYKHVSHDFEAPLAWTHQKLEGKYEYTLLFYLPRNAPFDLWQSDARHGVKLYVRRVFIMEASEKLLPRYLRFLRGVIDSNDLSLNVSREILQHSPAMEAMKTGASKRALTWLEELAKDRPEDFATFWGEFGTCLKEGIVEDAANREKIAALLRFASTENEAQAVTLADYIARMKPGQDTIYYITAESLAAAQHSPHLEIFRKKGIEVLLLHDRIDEWLTAHLSEYGGKRLQSIAKGELDLSGIGEETEQEKQEKQEQQEKQKSAGPAAEKLREALGERVKDVRITSRLTESPACLISDSFDISTNLERILREAGQNVPEMKPILEINPDHALIKRLAKMRSKEKIGDWAQILFDQAVLAEGALPEDPAGFVRRINALLAD